jgi:hypothetical protein
MSQTKFSNPVNPSTGPMSPSPSAERIKGGRGTTGSGARTTHEQDLGAEKIGYAGSDENMDKNQGNQSMGVHVGGKKPKAERNQNDQQDRKIG